jgi:hypothetical protein
MICPVPVFGRKSNESLGKPQHSRKAQLSNASLRGLVPRVSGLFPGCDVRCEFWVPDTVMISCFMSGSSAPRVTTTGLSLLEQQSKPFTADTECPKQLAIAERKYPSNFEFLPNSVLPEGQP